MNRLPIHEAERALIWRRGCRQANNVVMRELTGKIITKTMIFKGF